MPSHSIENVDWPFLRAAIASGRDSWTTPLRMNPQRASSHVRRRVGSTLLGPSSRMIQLLFYNTLKNSYCHGNGRYDSYDEAIRCGKGTHFWHDSQPRSRTMFPLSSSRALVRARALPLSLSFPIARLMDLLNAELVAWLRSNLCDRIEGNWFRSKCTGFEWTSTKGASAGSSFARVFTRLLLRVQCSLIACHCSVCCLYLTP